MEDRNRNGQERLADEFDRMFGTGAYGNAGSGAMRILSAGAPRMDASGPVTQQHLEARPRRPGGMAALDAKLGRPVRIGPDGLTADFICDMYRSATDGKSEVDADKKERLEMTCEDFRAAMDRYGESGRVPEAGHAIADAWVEAMAVEAFEDRYAGMRAMSAALTQAARQKGLEFDGIAVDCSKAGSELLHGESGQRAREAMYREVSGHLDISVPEVPGPEI